MTWGRDGEVSLAAILPTRRGDLELCTEAPFLTTNTVKLRSYRLSLKAQKWRLKVLMVLHFTLREYLRTQLTLA